MEVLGGKDNSFRVLSLISVIAERNFDNEFAMLTVGVLCQDGIAGEYWLGLTLLVDGGDFKLVEVAWFQALGSGAAAARLRKGNISNSRKYCTFEKAVVVRNMRQFSRPHC